MLARRGQVPQLCTVVTDSYPPQCSGPDVLGWRWNRVAHHTLNGVLWTDDVVIRGRLRGDALELVGSPRPGGAADRILPVLPRVPCPAPPVTAPQQRDGGAVDSGAIDSRAVACVLGGARSAAHLQQVARELMAAGSLPGRPSGRLWSVQVDRLAGRVDVLVTLVQGGEQQQLDQRFGAGVVRLSGLFVPVG